VDRGEAVEGGGDLVGWEATKLEVLAVIASVRNAVRK